MLLSSQPGSKISNSWSKLSCFGFLPSYSTTFRLGGLVANHSMLHSKIGSERSGLFLNTLGPANLHNGNVLMKQQASVIESDESRF
jgi:hypothetical protein